MKYILTILLATIMVAEVHAQQECILSYDTITSESDIKLRLSNLKTIDKRRWQKITRDHDVDGDFLGFGMDIGVDSSYSKFKEERTKVFRRYEYDEKIDNATKYVSQTVSDKAKDAYIACIEATAGSGIFIVPQRVTESIANITVVVNTPAGVNSARLELGGAKNIGAEDLDNIDNTIRKLSEDGKTSFTITRDNTKDISLAINGVKYLLGLAGFPATDTLLIVKDPVIVPPVDPTPPGETPVVFERPLGITKLTTKWWKTKVENVTDRTCSKGSPYLQFMWDGNSQMTYCAVTEKADLYLVDLKTKHGRGGCNTLGFEYTTYAWDGFSNTQTCALKRTFQQLQVAGQTRYIKKLKSSWRRACPEPYVELAEINGNNLKFCAVIGYLRPS